MPAATVCPSKDEPGMIKWESRMRTRGKVQVGILTEPRWNDGFVWCVLRASAARRMKTQPLQPRIETFPWKMLSWASV